jgi:hypothetical protein
MTEADIVLPSLGLPVIHSVTGLVIITMRRSPFFSKAAGPTRGRIIAEGVARSGRATYMVGLRSRKTG